MADINSLSFGCGNTLQANQLNIMADAIRSLITQVEDMSDQVGSYIPLSGSEKITGVLAPDTNEGYDLGKSTKRWGTVWASTGGFKTIDFYNQQTPFGKLGELYVGKDTSNNNEAILQFKHGNNNEEIVATRDWVNSQLNSTRINIGSTGSISEEQYNDESNYIKIESSSDNPIVIAGYDDNSVPIGIKFGDASTGDVLTVYNGKIYINDDIFSGENGVSVLDDLSDVTASAPGDGDFLMYDKTNGWVSSPLPESQIIHPGNVSLNEEYYLMYEKTIEHPSGRYSWVERPSGAKELNELNDVEIDDNKLGLGQVLVYSQVTDGENNTYNSWVNKTLSGSLTYDQSDSDKYLKVKSDGTGTEWVSGTTTGVSSINNITGDVTITGSGVSTNNNTITITGGGGGLTSGSWAAYFDGQTKDDNNLSDGYLYYTSSTGMSTTAVAPGSGIGSIVMKASDNTNVITLNSSSIKLKAGSNIVFQTEQDGNNQTINDTVVINSVAITGATIKGTNLSTINNKIVIPVASNNGSYGVIGTGYTNNDKNYKVQVDDNGNAYVNVPWTASGLTSGNWADYFNRETKNSPNTGYLYYDSTNDTITTSGGTSGVNSITGTTGDINFTITGDVYNNKLIKGEINERVVEKTNLNSNVGQEYLNKTSLTNLINALNNIENILIAKKSIDNNFAFWCAIKETTSIANGYFFYKGLISPTGSSGSSAKNIIFYKDSNGLQICATLYSTDYFACSYDVDGGPRTNDSINDWKINDSTDSKNGLLTTINDKINGGNGTYTWNSSNWIKTINASDISKLNVTKYI